MPSATPGKLQESSVIGYYFNFFFVSFLLYVLYMPIMPPLVILRAFHVLTHNSLGQYLKRVLLNLV